MRQYEPVWLELKRKRTARVTAVRNLHPRIIKAVTKEKWKDLAFKVELDPYVATLGYTIKHSIITFTLSLHRPLHGISENEL
jgi:hypothetical protein